MNMNKNELKIIHLKNKLFKILKKITYQICVGKRDSEFTWNHFFKIIEKIDKTDDFRFVLTMLNLIKYNKKQISLDEMKLFQNYLLT